jgi:hypothetical protein
VIPIHAYQLRSIKAEDADRFFDAPARPREWSHYIAYPLNTQRWVAGPFAVLAVNSRRSTTRIAWRGEVHELAAATPQTALREFWNAFELEPLPATRTE